MPRKSAPGADKPRYCKKYNDDWRQLHWRAEVLLEFIDPEDNDADKTYANIISTRRVASSSKS